MHRDLKAEVASQPSVNLDRSHDLAVAWQARGGFLTKLLYMPAEHADTPALA